MGAPTLWADYHGTEIPVHFDTDAWLPSGLLYSVADEGGEFGPDHEGVLGEQGADGRGGAYFGGVWWPSVLAIDRTPATVPERAGHGGRAFLGGVWLRGFIAPGPAGGPATGDFGGARTQGSADNSAGDSSHGVPGKGASGRAHTKGGEIPGGGFFGGVWLPSLLVNGRVVGQAAEPRLSGDVVEIGEPLHVAEGVIVGEDWLPHALAPASVPAPELRKAGQGITGAGYAPDQATRLGAVNSTFPGPASGEHHTFPCTADCGQLEDERC
jgi:hypothetical protein